MKAPRYYIVGRPANIAETWISEWAIRDAHSAQEITEWSADHDSVRDQAISLNREHALRRAAQ